MTRKSILMRGLCLFSLCISSLLYAECSVKKGVFEGSPAIVMESELIRVTIVPELSGRIAEYIWKPLGCNNFLRYRVKKGTALIPGAEIMESNFGGFKDLIWEHRIRRAERRYNYEIIKEKGESASVKVYFPEKSLRITRTMTIFEKSSELKIDVALTNTGEKPEILSYWAHTMVTVGGDYNPEEDYNYIPLRKNKKTSAGGHRLTTVEDDNIFAGMPENGYYPPKQPWCAVIDKPKKLLYAQIVSLEQLGETGAFHIWTGGGIWEKYRLSQEVIFAPWKYEKNQTREYNISIVMVQGMDKVTYVNRYLVLDIDPLSKTIFQRGEKIPLTLKLSSPREDTKIKLLMYLVDSKGRRYKGSAIDLSNLTPKQTVIREVRLNTDDCPLGSYKIKVLMKNNMDKEVDEFELLGFDVIVKE